MQRIVVQAIRQEESPTDFFWITHLYSWLLLRWLTGSINHVPIISSGNSCPVTSLVVSSEHAFAFVLQYG